MAEDLWNEDDIHTEDDEQDEAISISYDIASYPSDYTLAGIADMFRDGDISIPPYQRQFVWSIKQASLLIDSFLSGLPVPPVFFYIDDENENLVIDGQQRIRSIAYFLEGYFGEEDHKGKRQIFKLAGLNKKSPYHEKTFADLSKSDQRKLKQSVLRAVNIRQLGPTGDSTSAYHIFERLNTGGTPLKPQEIRNCVFTGELSEQLKLLNRNPYWRKILGAPNPDKFQKDVEFILRIFALVGNIENYEKPIKEFLNKTMKKHQNLDTKKSLNFFTEFPLACKLVIETLGEKPFHLRGPLNVAALDSVMSTITENLEKINEKKLLKNYLALKEDDEFVNLTTINTTDGKNVKGRFELVASYLLKK